jgi:hypothetical protein
LNDLQSIQEIFEERGQRLDEILERTLQNKSMVQEWKLYKELLRKLTNERRQIEERLQNVKAQLHALQSTIIVADS